MKHSSNRVISVEEIKAKEQAARASAQELIQAAKAQRHTSPTQEFLRHIHPFVVKLHKHGVSYVRIARWIMETYSYKISAQSVRKYLKSDNTEREAVMNHSEKHMNHIQGANV